MREEMVKDSHTSKKPHSQTIGSLDAAHGMPLCPPYPPPSPLSASELRAATGPVSVLESDVYINPCAHG